MSDEQRRQDEQEVYERQLREADALVERSIRRENMTAEERRQESKDHERRLHPDSRVVGAVDDAIKALASGENFVRSRAVLQALTENGRRSISFQAYLMDKTMESVTANRLALSLIGFEDNDVLKMRIPDAVRQDCIDAFSYDDAAWKTMGNTHTFSALTQSVSISLVRMKQDLWSRRQGHGI